MRCPICGWVDAGNYHSALHTYTASSSRARVPESGVDPWFWLTGWAIMNLYAQPRGERIIWVGKNSLTPLTRPC